MPNILPFPSRDRGSARYGGGPEPTGPGARWDKVQRGIRDLLALRARAKLEIEGAIAALEKNYQRTRDGALTAEDPSTKTKLQNDFDFLEQQLERVKLEAARL